MPSFSELKSSDVTQFTISQHFQSCLHYLTGGLHETRAKTTLSTFSGGTLKFNLRLVCHLKKLTVLFYRRYKVCKYLSIYLESPIHEQCMKHTAHSYCMNTFNI